MENMPFEVWEHRITEILDKKLEPIIRELHNLAENQRTMARIEAFNIANQCRRSVLEKKPKTSNTFFELLTAKLTATLKEVDASANPVSAITDLHDWCIDEEDKLGIEFIQPPD